MTRPPAAVIVGLSGCSSSGKTTLARLLRDLFCSAAPSTTTSSTPCFVLHEDDFYRPEQDLPVRDNGLLDWDCPDAIDVAALERALEHIRAEGTFPPFVDSKEDQNSVGPCPASEATIAAMRQKVAAWLQPGRPGHAIFGSNTNTNKPPRVCLLDGFLLYAPPRFDRVMALLDVKLFLQVGRARATRRRAARDGYVTLEGFWRDPPGYVDEVVWPNYVAAHRWMFADGDVDAGRLAWDVLAERGILAQKKKESTQHGEAEEGGVADWDFEETFEWVVDSVLSSLEAWHVQEHVKRQSTRKPCAKRDVATKEAFLV